MTADMQQSKFTHAKCLNCGHFGFIDKFNPRLVDCDKSESPYIEWSITYESSDSDIKVQVIDMNCPVCNDMNVEGCYPNEVN